MVQEAHGFISLAEHELRCARRYRRYFTIVIVPPVKEGGERRPALLRNLRDTDEVMETREGLTILMTETDRNGAWSALARIRARYGDLMDLRFGVASYPQDGHSVETLLGVAQCHIGDTRASLPPV